MKKITLMLFAMLCVTFSFAQHTFAPIAGPTNVAAGSPVTLNLNDIANSVGVPAGAYGSFTITADWVAGGGGPWSSEAELQVSTTAGIVADVDPPSGGSGSNGNPTTLTFSGNLSTVYDPSVDGLFDIILGQSYAGSDGDWSNISVTIDATVPAPPNDTCAGVIDLGGETSPLTASTLNANNDFGQDCLTNTGAPDVVYSILVPNTFMITIEQTSNSYDSKHRLAYGATCPGDVLITCTDDPDTQQEIWLNNTGSDQTVYWIQSAYSTASGDFTLAWSVDAGPACADPSDGSASNITDTSANLGWTENGTAGLWNIEWGADMFTQGTGTVVSGVTNPYNLMGLTEDSPYDFYVQSDCTGGLLSAWIGPFSFSTLPAPIAPPYLNDFTVFPGTGWTEAGSGDPITGPMTLGSGDWTSDDYGNDIASPNGKSARINLWQAVDQEWLISPIFDLTGAGPYYLNMDVALTPFSGSAATSFGSDDEVQVLITSDGGTTWVNLLTYNLANQPGTSREATPEVDLSSYAGNNVQIAIWATDGTVDDAEDNNFYVDNFQVTTSSLGIEDVAFNGFKYFPNPVNGTLSLRAQDNIQAASVYNMLGQEVLRTTPNGLQDELDMSGLNTGAYFLKVRINDVEQNFRIIKQ